jgi:hypothetical protein
MHHWQKSGQMGMGQQGMGQATNQLCNTIGLFDSQIPQWNRIMSQQSQSSPKSLEARAQLGALTTWRNSLQQSLNRLQHGGPRGMMAAAGVKETCAKALTAIQRSAAYLSQEYGIQPPQQLIQSTAPGFALKARQTRAPEFRVGTARRIAPIGTTRTLAGMRVPDFRPIPIRQMASRWGASRGASQQFRQPWQSQMGQSWQFNQPRSQQIGTISSSMATMGQFGPASFSRGAQYGQMGTSQYGTSQYGASRYNVGSSQYGMGISRYGSHTGKKNY